MMSHWLWVPGLGTFCFPLVGFQVEILNFRVDLSKGTLQVLSLQSAWPEVTSKVQPFQGALGLSSAVLLANWDKDNPRLPDARLGSLEPGLTERDKETPSTLQPVACSDLPRRAHCGPDLTAVLKDLEQGSVPSTAGHLPWPPELALLLAVPQAWN